MLVTWLIHVCDVTQICLIHMWDMTHSQMTQGHERFSFRLCQYGDMTHSFREYRDMTHSFMRVIRLAHDSYVCVTWLIQRAISTARETFRFVCVVTWIIHVNDFLFRSISSSHTSDSHIRLRHETQKWDISHVTCLRHDSCKCVTSAWHHVFTVVRVRDDLPVWWHDSF